MTPETAVMVLGSADPDRHSLHMRAQAAQVVARLVEHALPAPTLDATGPGGHPQTWRFVGYRPGLVLGDTHDANQMNPPDAAQYAGVIWPDGTCTLRWLTAKRSAAQWDSFADAMDIHGHPEYGTRIVWLDKPPQEAVDKLVEMANALAEKRAEEAEAERVRQLPETPSPAEEAVRRDRERRTVASLAVKADPEVTGIAEQQSNGHTLGVCLDCASAGTSDAMVVPFRDRADAESWVSTHREPGLFTIAHRVVTVPGWPEHADAVAIARAHVEAGR
jgi:hypothetical protein